MTLLNHCTSRPLLALILTSATLGCRDSKEGRDTSPTTDTPDLTEVLGDGHSRAGVVTDETALFGGISAEGQAGDVKLYNNRVQFVIQAPGESSYYVGYGGSVIDADIVRPAGQPGQDLIDDGSMMVGLGRMFNAETVEVISDGTGGGAAVVRATGTIEPLTILTGTLEAAGIIQDRDATIVTDYILEPDSWLLRLESTVLWEDLTTPVQLADMAFVAGDISSPYKHRAGHSGGSPDTYGWDAIVGDRNEVAFALMQGPEDGEFSANSVLEIVGSLGPLLIGSNPTIDLSEGDEVQWTRYWGVGPDIGTLTNEWYGHQGTDVEMVSGQVAGDGAGVSGARVHVLDSEGLPITMALTTSDGHFEASVPTDTAAQVVAESRGPGVYFDGQPGAGWYAPYAAPVIRQATLDTIESGAPPVAFSPGFGVGAAVDAGVDLTLDLTPPGMLNVTVEDNGPAVVRVAFAGGDHEGVDAALVPGRPNGYAAWLYIRDGEGSMPLEPGTYEVVVHRGPTHEAHQETIEVLSNESVSVSASLEASIDTDGFRSLDPHSHGAPSGDGAISMEGRLAVSAAHGLDVHFGTDHDHVADYRVLLAPMGLATHLASVVADEVSPSMRGHHNAYPLETVEDAVNGGALRWWQNWLEWGTTEGLYGFIRSMRSDGDILIQANHPSSSAGLFSNAGWHLESGSIRQPSRWSEDFDAFEVLNDGGYSSVVPYYLDMLNRGLSPTPVGVSDSHTHASGVGENRTWVPMELADIRDLNNDHIRDAIRHSGTIASFGPLFIPTIDGAWAPGGSFDGAVTVDVELRTPSWMVVDTLHVFENGIETQTIAFEGESTATVQLDPELDTVVVLTVDGSTDMAPVYPGHRPWALAQAFFVDVDGGGWTPPLPALTLD